MQAPHQPWHPNYSAKAPAVYAYTAPHQSPLPTLHWSRLSVQLDVDVAPVSAPPMTSVAVGPPWRPKLRRPSLAQLAKTGLFGLVRRLVSEGQPPNEFCAVVSLLSECPNLSDERFCGRQKRA